MNSVAVTVDGYTLTGADLVTLGALGEGNQDSPLDNQLVTITGLGAFTQVTFLTGPAMRSSSVLALAFQNPRPGPC
jgi:hypothetical protein